jgi:hypothetical protein
MKLYENELTICKQLWIRSIDFYTKIRKQFAKNEGKEEQTFIQK